MKTLAEIKNKFPTDVDWNMGKTDDNPEPYEVYHHTTSNNPKTYLLHSWENNIWVYDVTEGISVIQTYSNKTLTEVKEILG